jgi:pentapeptide MXKDX repeat protein
MTLTTRFSLVACAAAVVALGIILAPPTGNAQGTTGKDDMKKGEMKGEMKDTMKKDTMSGGNMKKDEKKDMMKKDDMKK